MKKTNKGELILNLTINKDETEPEPEFEEEMLEARPGRLLRDEKDGRPIQEILLSNGDAWYLSPFRGYSFQVSYTFDGCGTVGDSQVIGLKNILGIEVPEEKDPRHNITPGGPRFIFEMMKGQALFAVMRACRFSKLYFPFYFKTYECDGYEFTCNDWIDPFIIEVIRDLDPDFVKKLGRKKGEIA